VQHALPGTNALMHPSEYRFGQRAIASLLRSTDLGPASTILPTIEQAVCLSIES